MSDLKPLGTTPSTLGLVFGAFLVVLIAAGAIFMPDPGSALVAVSLTPSSTPQQAKNESTPASGVSPTVDAVPSPSVSAASTALSATPVTNAATPAPTSGPTTYQVKSGDTLSEIAERFGVSSSAILEANGLPNADSLSEGQKLIIPLKATSTPVPTAITTPPMSSATAIPTSTAMPTSTPVSTPTPTPAESRVYVVQEGDTMLGIAIKFGVEVEDILRANGLTDPDAVAPGQKLTIP